MCTRYKTLKVLGLGGSLIDEDHMREGVEGLDLIH